MLGYLLAAIIAQTPPEAVSTVSGVARMHPQLCKGGGAAVTREEMEAVPPPYPMPKLRLHVARGGVISRAKPFAKITTNAKGRFSLQLPHGTWCFYDAERALPPPASPSAPVTASRGGSVDPGCMAAELARCDLVLRVKGEVTNAEVAFTQRCDFPWSQPCYVGPMPP